jgi:hypothetical protein
MGRPKLENPRTEQVTIRITVPENELLEAIGALDRVHPNEVAYRFVLEGLGAARGDQFVEEQLDLHRRRAASSNGEVTNLRATAR